jgi:hypothetical protein
MVFCGGFVNNFGMVGGVGLGTSVSYYLVLECFDAGRF